MTKISIYNKDTDVRGNDKWIGSDAQNQNRTKNFTPDNVAAYFNENQVIDLGVELRYFYDTLDPLQERVYGSITFETEIGPQVNFSSISTFILSKYTMGHTDVSQFLDFLIGSNVLLSRSNNINMFGYYKIDNIEPYLPDPNFFVVTLTFENGNGYMKEDEDYFISLVQFEQEAPATPTLQSVTDAGNTTTNSIAVESVDYYSLVDTSAVGTQNNNTNSYAYIGADGVLGLNNGVVESNLRTTNVTQGINLEFPDKTSGTYTIATTEDITVPTLQSVTDEGNTITGSGSYKTTLNNFDISVENTLSNTKTRITGDGIIEFVNANSKRTWLYNTSVSNDFTNFYFPNKAAGNYALATINDIPVVSGFVPYTGATGNVNIGDYNYIGSNITLNGLSTDGGALNISQGPTATINGSGYSSITAQGTDSLNFYLANNLDGKQFNLLTNNITLNDTLNYTLPSTSGTIALISDIPAVTGFVPYTGANQNVNLGEYELKAGQLTLDTTPTGTSVVGTTQWNDTTGVSETKLKGGNVILKNGVDLVARVVNKVTPNATLLRANYTAVRISGAQGQRLAVAYAQANNDNNSADTIGLVCENIATNQEGFIMTMGQFEEINTTGSLQGETWADGDVLYLSPTTAGRLTNIKPTGLTGHIVVMGYVEYAHAIHGKIYVKIMNGWELDELHNVYINQATLANNDGLFYDSSDQLWKNETIASALGYTPFQLPSLTSGSVLFSNGTTIAQDNSNLFWDDTNNRLGIGTNAPNRTFVVYDGSAPHIQLATAASGLTTSSGFQLRIVSNNVLFTNFQASNMVFGNSGATHVTLFNSGNLLVSSTTTTDAGYKLDVNGTARVSGTTTITPAANTPSITSSTYLVTGSGTTPLLDLRGTLNTTAPVVPYIFDITNTASGSGSFLVQFRRNGNYILAIGLNDGLIYGNTYISATGAWNVSARENAINGVRFGSINSSTHTSGNRNHFNLTETFVPTSGTGTYSSIQSNPTINQTGGANGITRGLYINPTLTAAADFRAIENSVGKVCLNTTSGNTMIGTTTDAGFKLDVNGTARVSGNATFGTLGTGTGMFWDNTNNGLTLGGTTLDSNIIFQINGSKGARISGTGAGFGYSLVRGSETSSFTNSASAGVLSSTNTLIFNTSATIRVLINSSGNVLINTTTDIASSKLTIESTTQGFLPPRMTTTQKNAIATPAAGLVVYDTTLGKLCVRTAAAWETITSV